MATRLELSPEDVAAASRLEAIEDDAEFVQQVKLHSHNPSEALRQVLGHSDLDLHKDIKQFQKLVDDPTLQGVKQKSGPRLQWLRIVARYRDVTRSQHAQQQDVTQGAGSSAQPMQQQPADPQNAGQLQQPVQAQESRTWLQNAIQNQEQSLQTQQHSTGVGPAQEQVHAAAPKYSKAITNTQAGLAGNQAVQGRGASQRAQKMVTDARAAGKKGGLDVRRAGPTSTNKGAGMIPRLMNQTANNPFTVQHGGPGAHKGRCNGCAKPKLLEYGFEGEHVKTWCRECWQQQNDAQHEAIQGFEMKSRNNAPQGTRLPQQQQQQQQQAGHGRPNMVTGLFNQVGNQVKNVGQKIGQMFCAKKPAATPAQHGKDDNPMPTMEHRLPHQPAMQVQQGRQQRQQQQPTGRHAALALLPTSSQQPQQSRALRPRQQRASQAVDEVQDGPINLISDDDEPNKAKASDSIDEGGLDAAAGTRRSTRIKARHEQVQSTLPSKLFQGLKLRYPQQGSKSTVDVAATDLDRVEDGEFLNDTIIDFYLKYIEIQLPEDVRQRCYFFSSFFYKKLTEVLPKRMQQARARELGAASGLYKTGSDSALDEQGASQDEAAANTSQGRKRGSGGTSKVQETHRANHERVKKWTKSVDIFSKDYVFVPIHDAIHWSLAVICHPSHWISELKEPGDCMVLHLDSMTGQCHKWQPITSNLRAYLYFEWQRKVAEQGTFPCQFMQQHPVFEMPAFTTFQSKLVKTRQIETVPQQDNHCDCGLYVLAYIEYWCYVNPPHIDAELLPHKPSRGRRSSNDPQQTLLPVTSSPKLVPDHPEFLTSNWFNQQEGSGLRYEVKYLIHKFMYEQGKESLEAQQEGEELDHRLQQLEQLKEHVDKYEADKAAGRRDLKGGEYYFGPKEYAAFMAERKAKQQVKDNEARLKAGDAALARQQQHADTNGNATTDQKDPDYIPIDSTQEEGDEDIEAEVETQASPAKRHAAAGPTGETPVPMYASNGRKRRKSQLQEDPADDNSSDQEAGGRQVEEAISSDITGDDLPASQEIPEQQQQGTGLQQVSPGVKKYGLLHEHMAMYGDDVDEDKETEQLPAGNNSAARADAAARGQAEAHPQAAPLTSLFEYTEPMIPEARKQGRMSEEGQPDVEVAAARTGKRKADEKVAAAGAGKVEEQTLLKRILKFGSTAAAAAAASTDQKVRVRQRHTWSAGPSEVIDLENELEEQPAGSNAEAAGGGDGDTEPPRAKRTKATTVDGSTGPRRSQYFDAQPQQVVREVLSAHSDEEVSDAEQKGKRQKKAEPDPEDSPAEAQDDDDVQMVAERHGSALPQHAKHRSTAATQQGASIASPGRGKDAFLKTLTNAQQHAGHPQSPVQRHIRFADADDKPVEQHTNQGQGDPCHRVEHQHGPHDDHDDDVLDGAGRAQQVSRRRAPEHKAGRHAGGGGQQHKHHQHHTGKHRSHTTQQPLAAEQTALDEGDTHLVVDVEAGQQQIGSIACIEPQCNPDMQLCSMDQEDVPGEATLEQQQQQQQQHNGHHTHALQREAGPLADVRVSQDRLQAAQQQLVQHAAQHFEQRTSVHQAQQAAAEQEDVIVLDGSLEEPAQTTDGVQQPATQLRPACGQAGRSPFQLQQSLFAGREQVARPRQQHSQWHEGEALNNSQQLMHHLAAADGTARSALDVFNQPGTLQSIRPGSYSPLRSHKRMQDPAQSRAAPHVDDVNRFQQAWHKHACEATIAAAGLKAADISQQQAQHTYSVYDDILRDPKCMSLLPSPGPTQSFAALLQPSAATMRQGLGLAQAAGHHVASSLQSQQQQHYQAAVGMYAQQPRTPQLLCAQSHYHSTGGLATVVLTSNSAMPLSAPSSPAPMQAARQPAPAGLHLNAALATHAGTSPLPSPVNGPLSLSNCAGFGHTGTSNQTGHQHMPGSVACLHQHLSSSVQRTTYNSPATQALGHFQAPTTRYQPAGLRSEPDAATGQDHAGTLTDSSHKVMHAYQHQGVQQQQQPPCAPMAAPLYMTGPLPSSSQHHIASGGGDGHGTASQHNSWHGPRPLMAQRLTSSSGSWHNGAPLSAARGSMSRRLDAGNSFPDMLKGMALQGSSKGTAGQLQTSSHTTAVVPHVMLPGAITTRSKAHAVDVHGKAEVVDMTASDEDAALDDVLAPKTGGIAKQQPLVDGYLEPDRPQAAGMAPSAPAFVKEPKSSGKAAYTQAPITACTRPASSPLSAV